MRNHLRGWLLAGLVLLLLPAALALASGDTGPVGDGTGARALRHGDRGEQVTALQQLLAARGFEPGPVDGIFGPLTEAAVRRAQQQYGIEPDGLAGVRTLAALSRLANQRGAAETPGSDLVVHRAAGAVALDQVADVGKAVAVMTVAAPVQSAAGQAPGAGAFRGQAAARGGTFSLTFSGDPNPDLLPGLLAALERHGMRATFFVTGRMARERSDLVRRIAVSGHEVGSSGMDQIDMTRVTERMAEAQLKQARGLIQAAAGAPPRFFRPPLGRFSEVLIAQAAAQGQITTLWSNPFATDSGDLAEPDLRDRVLRAVHPGAVLLLHQDRATTVSAIDSLLAEMRARGFTSVPLSGLPECESCR